MGVRHPMVGWRVIAVDGPHSGETGVVERVTDSLLYPVCVRIDGDNMTTNYKPEELGWLVENEEPA